MRACSRPSGTSLVEVMVIALTFTMLMASFVAVHKTTRDFSERTYAQMRAREENLRNLAAVSNLLRGAAASSLGGFDVNGVATSPSFQAVTGADAAGRILGPVQSIAWQADTHHDPAHAGLGELAVDVGGVKVPIASQIPNGGFVVRRTANTLRITLTTSFSASGRTAASVSGDASVSLRN